MHCNFFLIFHSLSALPWLMKNNIFLEACFNIFLPHVHFVFHLPSCLWDGNVALNIFRKALVWFWLMQCILSRMLIVYFAVFTLRMQHGNNDKQPFFTLRMQYRNNDKQWHCTGISCIWFNSWGRKHFRMWLERACFSWWRVILL